MNKNISEDIKNKVLNTFMHTKKPLRSIVKEYNLAYEDVITILEDYKSKNGDITRTIKEVKESSSLAKEGKTSTNANRVSKNKRVSKIRQYAEEIYKLRKQGLSYQAISHELKKRGINISDNSVREICKEIYALNEEVEPNLINKNPLLDDELIYNLREEGFTHRDIQKLLEEKGIRVSYETIRKKCKKIYKSKGENEADLRIKELDTEKIYMLRKQGLSYIEIAEEFKSEGIEIDAATIRKRCKEIYTLKEEIVPKARKIIDENNEENKRIYELRNKGLGYAKISKELAVSGINLSVMAVRKRCKKLYDLKNKEEPIVKSGAKKKTREETQELDTNIYILREQGLTYEAITDELVNLGIKISITTVGKRCKDIYASRGEQQPKIKRKQREHIYKKRITDQKSEKINEEIYELREQGLKFEEISQELRKKGINLSRQTMGLRYKKLLKNNEQQLAKAILNLATTRKASIEQIQQIAEYYGVDLEKTMNSLEESTNSPLER